MTELTAAEANEVAALLARVVPRGHEEADRIELFVRRLTRRPLPHGHDLTA